jgi:sulfonate transport system substrate-binding protein
VVPPALVPVLFAKEGIAQNLGKTYTLDYIHYNETPTVTMALAAGEVDIVPMAFAQFGIAVAGGLDDLRIIADEDVDGAEGYYSTEFLVRKDSGINSVKDLKGKVLTTIGIGSAVDMASRKMLRLQGLEDKRDYTVIEAQFPNMKALLSERKVDLIVTPAVFAYDSELQEIARPLFTQRDAFGKSQLSAWVAHQDFLTKNRAVLVDFLADVIRAVRWYVDPANHAEAVQNVSRFTKIPAARFEPWLFTTRDYYRSPDALPDLDAIQRPLQEQRALGFLKADVDVKAHADLSIVQEAARQVK